MVAVEVTKKEQALLNVYRNFPQLKGAFEALVTVARNGELAAKSERALTNASAELPGTKTAPTISIEHIRAALSIEEMRAVLRAEEMKKELRAWDYLYDNDAIWKQLGASKVPAVPDAVIQEAHEKGGRVILRCSSISKKTEVLKKANHSVAFWGFARQAHYQTSVSQPEWIVVPSTIPRSTLAEPKSPEKPAPTPEDWFSVMAYARLDGGRQPKECGEGLFVFTTKSRTVVGSEGGTIVVCGSDSVDRGLNGNVGHAGFYRRWKCVDRAGIFSSVKGQDTQGRG